MHGLRRRRGRRGSRAVAVSGYGGSAGGNGKRQRAASRAAKKPGPKLYWQHGLPFQAQDCVAQTSEEYRL